MKQQKQQAFTLVETLMAVAIVGLIMASVYGTFHSVVDVTETAAEATEQVQRERIAIKTLEDALSGIVYYEQNPDKYAFVVDATGSYPVVSFATRVPPDFLGAKEFGAQRLRRVEFRVDEDDFEAGPTLVMYQTPINMATDSIDAEPPRKWVLGSDLFTYVMQFYSTINNQWVNEWEETNSIPSRIKVELSFKGPGRDYARLDETLKRDIVIFSDKVTQAVQNPALPGGKTSGKGKTNSSSRPTTKISGERITALRKQLAEQTGRSGNDGRSRYTDAQREAYRKRMQEIYQKRMAARRGSDGPPIGLPGGGSVRIPVPGGDNGQPATPPTPPAGGGGLGIPGLTQINDALMDYQTLTGQPAGNLDDLVSSGVLSSLPDPPAGMQWQYNPQTGTVSAVPAT